MAKKRVISPKFISHIHMPSSKELLEIYKRERLWGEGSPTQIAAHHINSLNLRNSMDGVGKFYQSLCSEIYGGKILKINSAPLIKSSSIDAKFQNGFKPDVVIYGDLGNTYIEVKAASNRSGKFAFSPNQYLNYTEALMNDKGSKMYAALFRYGSSCDSLNISHCKGNKIHECKRSCLVEKLAGNTKEMMLIPHNLLTYLLSVSKKESRNHENSGSRDVQNYKIPLAGWLTLLRDNFEKPEETIKKIHEQALKKGWTFEKKPDFDRFYLGGIKARQMDAPEIFCHGYQIGNKIDGKKVPFRIIEFENQENGSWVKYLKEDLENFLLSMGIIEEYEHKRQYLEDLLNRERSIVSGNAEEIVRPSDDIPF